MLYKNDEPDSRKKISEMEYLKSYWHAFCERNGTFCRSSCQSPSPKPPQVSGLIVCYLTLQKNNISNNNKYRQEVIRVDADSLRNFEKNFQEWKGLYRGISIKELPHPGSTSGFSSGDWVETKEPLLGLNVSGFIRGQLTRSPHAACILPQPRESNQFRRRIGSWSSVGPTLSNYGA